jgi:hypothetical protein
MHSWRTEIFRIIQPEQVRGYNFDEPWDSEQNILFAKRHIPPWFHCQSDSTASSTSYVLLIGKNCLFKEESYQPTLDDVADEATLLVESPNSGMLWTEPRDADCTDPECGPSCGTDGFGPSGHPDGESVAIIVNRGGELRHVRTK